MQAGEVLDAHLGERGQLGPAGQAEAEALVVAAVEATGRVDVLVNNAVARGDMVPFDTVPDEEWTALLMREAGWGRPRAGLVGRPGRPRPYDTMRTC